MSRKSRLKHVGRAVPVKVSGRDTFFRAGKKHGGWLRALYNCNPRIAVALKNVMQKQHVGALEVLRGRWAKSDAQQQNVIVDGSGSMDVRNRASASRTWRWIHGAIPEAIKNTRRRCPHVIGNKGA